MRLYLARHGESEGNRLHVVHGQTDFPLTERGRTQALALKAALSDAAVQRVVCSPLLRARETAALASPLTAVVDPRLTEQDMGRWENVSPDAACASAPALWAAMTEDWTDDAAAPPGGEPFSALLSRTAQALDALLSMNSDTLAVCHAGVMTASLVHLLGLTGREALRVRFEPGTFIAFEKTSSGIRLLTPLVYEEKETAHDHF